jgi:Tfp pilus assembly protein PilN
LKKVTRQGEVQGKAAAAQPALVAVLDEHSGGARLLVAKSTRESLTIAEARELAGPTALAQAGVVLRELGVSRVTRIVPGGTCVVRCVQLPAPEQAGEAGERSLESSGALMAEAELPEDVPQHRRGSGVITDVARPGLVSMLLVGWRGSVPEGEVEGEIEETWVARPAALAAIKGGAGRLAACIDADEGTVTLVASGPARTVVRELLGDSSEQAEWRGEVERAAAGAWEAAGGAPGEVEESVAQGLGEGVIARRRIVLEASSLAMLGKRVTGMREGRAWMDTWGLAIGAALIASEPRASVRGLGLMTAAAREPVLSIPERVVSWVSRGSRPGWVIAAALVGAFVVPMSFAWARATILDARASKVEALEGREALEKQAAFYAQLETTRWPMTKLIADIGAQAPVGVVVTNMRMSPGQPLTIAGRADSSDLVNTLVENLSATKVFAEVSVGRQESNEGGGVEFDLTARVARPFIPAKRAEDFVAKPLAVRLHGEGATNTQAPASERSKSTRTSSRRTGTDSDGASGANSGSSGNTTEGASGDRRPSASRSTEPPAAIADEAIAKLDGNGAMKEWSQRQSFLRSNPSLDSGVKERLQSEVDKLRARMQATRAGGGT